MRWLSFHWMCMLCTQHSSGEMSGHDRRLLFYLITVCWRFIELAYCITFVCSADSPHVEFNSGRKWQKIIVVYNGSPVYLNSDLLVENILNRACWMCVLRNLLSSLKILKCFCYLAIPHGYCRHWTMPLLLPSKLLILHISQIVWDCWM
jgi:hypothetical protein